MKYHLYCCKCFCRQKKVIKYGVVVKTFRRVKRAGTFAGADIEQLVSFHFGENLVA